MPLRFGSQGRFRVVQLTDCHFGAGPGQDARTERLIAQVLEVERPDLVVLTGDVIDGERCRDAAAAWRQAARPMVERRIPWCSVFGNHDDEGRADRRALLRLQQRLPFCLSRAGPRSVSGVGNYALALLGAGRGSQPAAILYFMDSQAYSRTGAGTYGWFGHDQVAWYRRSSRRLARGGRRLPGLAFFHIPLPEWETAWTEGYDRKGNRAEFVNCPRINSGMFAAFHERGDVLGAFCGHDHLNDGEATLFGIRLCYGRATGFGGYGKQGFARGARVIELAQGRREFETWLRLAGGTREDQGAAG